MKTLFLTGGNGEIGQAIAEAFKQDGYRVVAPTRKEMNLDNEDSIIEFLNNNDQPFDAFVHCAGINDPKPINDILLSDVVKTLQVNALSFYSIINRLLRTQRLKNNGHVVGISSIYGSFARRGRFSYVASKHCLNGMLKSLAIELGEFNIKANIVSPGFVDTKMTRKNNSLEVIEGFIKKIPLGRLALPADIARVVHFVGSSANSYINGQEIIVDGGYSIGGFEK